MAGAAGGGGEGGGAGAGVGWAGALSCGTAPDGAASCAVGDHISALNATAGWIWLAVAPQTTARASKPAISKAPGVAHCSPGAGGGSKYLVSAA